MMMITANSRARKGEEERRGEGGVWKNLRGLVEDFIHELYDDKSLN